MATPKFKMLSQVLGAPEEGITYPLGVLPEEQPGLFEDASDAALARENALPKEGYVPAGVGPVVEPSMDSPLAAMPSGLRSRKPVDFAPDTTKLQGKLAGFLSGSRSLQGSGFGRPLSDEELAAESERARKLMAEDDAASRDIPTRSASTRVDAPVAAISTQPAVTSTSPAGPADSSGRANLPAPSSEGAGGDSSERDLYLARLAAQSAAGFGGMGAGKNIDMGIADTLGERLKQVQALRAKREEKALGDVEERSNLNAAIDSYKQLFPDQADALERLRGSTNKPAVLREQLNAWRQMMEWEKAKKPVAEARVEQMGAGTALTKAKIPEVGLEGESKRKLRAAQVAKIYKDMELAGAKLALDERKTLEQAQQSKDPFKKLESLNTIADKKEFGGFTTLAGDLGDLERVAPGFVTRGEVPEWLTREQQALGQNWPTSTDPRVVDFLAAYGKVANEERHRQYGSAQTDGELRAFMQQLNASPLSAGPQVLAQQVKRFGQAAGRVAKGRLTRYNNVFGAENVDTVFAPEWKPLFDAGGVFAAQGSPFVAARPAAAGGAPEAATVTIKRKTDGKTKTVPAADRAKWLANPEFEEVK